jgi:hypothetical protein
MRMDADEYIPQELEKEIFKKLESIEDVVFDIYIKRRA